MASLQVFPGAVGEGRGDYMAGYLCWKLKFLLLFLFSCSVVSSSLWLCRVAACQASLSLAISWSLPKLMSIDLVMLLEFAQTHVHWVGDAVQLPHPLSSPSPLPSVFHSIRVFSNESALHISWPKYWSFSISPSNEYSGLISFRIDWFDSLQSKGLSRVFSNTTVQKHQLFDAQLSL